MRILKRLIVSYQGAILCFLFSLKLTDPLIKSLIPTHIDYNY